MCENADTEINRATIESARWRGPIIVAVKAKLLNLCFVPVFGKSFSHGLGHLQTKTRAAIYARYRGEAVVEGLLSGSVAAE